MRLVAAYVLSAEGRLQRDSVRALCNLLARPEAEQELERAFIIDDVLPKLIEVVRSDAATTEVLRLAALALSHMSEDEFKRVCVDSGALQALRKLNRTSVHDEVQEASDAAARSISATLSPTSRRAYCSALTNPRSTGRSAAPALRKSSPLYRSATVAAKLRARASAEAQSAKGAGGGGQGYDTASASSTESDWSTTSWGSWTPIVRMNCRGAHGLVTRARSEPACLVIAHDERSGVPRAMSGEL